MKRTIQRLELDDISSSLRQLSFTPLNFGHFVCRKASMDKASYLSHYRLCIVKSGSFRIGKDADGYFIHSGDALIMAPNILYRATSLEENSIFYYLDFTFDLPDHHQVFNNLIHLKDFRYFPNLINNRQMENLTHMDHTVQMNFPGTYLMVECMLMRVLIVMLKMMKETHQTYIVLKNDSAKERLVIQCIEYIDQHLSVPFSIKEMADELNYSENYIYKVFKETFRVSCKTFILDHRLSKSLHDLNSSTKSISEIAETYGFSSIYHFSAAFKKKYGYSPSNLRKDI